MDRLADRVAPAEQLLLEFRVDDRHGIVGQIFQSRERAPGMDVAAVHLHPLCGQPRHLD